jgi:hypothetical protein
VTSDIGLEFSFGLHPPIFGHLEELKIKMTKISEIFMILAKKRYLRQFF